MASAKRATNKSSVNTTKRQRNLRGVQDPILQPRQDDTVFPFLDLPGEIRNMIYEYALVDKEHSVRFEAVEERQHNHYTVNRIYRGRPEIPDRDDIPNVIVPSLDKDKSHYPKRGKSGYMQFGVQLLQLCHQINEEGAPIFYGKNLFVFDSIIGLHNFLSHFEQKILLLRKLGLANETTGRPGESIRYAIRLTPKVFNLLGRATNLEAFYMTKQYLNSIGFICSTLMAKRFFFKAYSWFSKLELEKRDISKILHLPSSGPDNPSAPVWYDTKEGREQFLDQLNLLSGFSTQKETQTDR